MNNTDMTSFYRRSNTFIAGAITLFLVIIIIGLLLG